MKTQNYKKPADPSKDYREQLENLCTVRGSPITSREWLIDFMCGHERIYSLMEHIHYYELRYPDIYH